MRHRHVLLAATILALAAPALAGPPEDFKALTDEYWAFVDARISRPSRRSSASAIMTTG